MTDDTRWIARITPTPSNSVADLLHLPLSLDVWERQQETLVVAAAADQLRELERRKLALVEWIEPVADFLNREQQSGQS
jgi:hypothetical protein